MEYALVLGNNQYYIQAKDFIDYEVGKTVISIIEADNLYQAAEKTDLLNKVNENSLLVVGVKPSEPPRIEVIESGLKSMQQYVGGYIELGCSNKGHDYFVNEEGKLDQLPLNRAIIYDGVVVDVTAGNMLFTMSNEEGETVSLDEETVIGIEEEFKLPQIFTYDQETKNINVIDVTDNELACFIKESGITMYPANYVKDMYDTVLYHFARDCEEIKNSFDEEEEEEIEEDDDIEL